MVAIPSEFTLCNGRTEAVPEIPLIHQDGSALAGTIEIQDTFLPFQMVFLIMTRHPRIRDGPATRVGAMKCLRPQSRQIIATAAPDGPFIGQQFAFAFPSPQCGRGNPKNSAASRIPTSFELMPKLYNYV